jgi:hypothetical protein
MPKQHLSFLKVGLSTRIIQYNSMNTKISYKLVCRKFLFKQKGKQAFFFFFFLNKKKKKRRALGRYTWFEHSQFVLSKLRKP